MRPSSGIGVRVGTVLIGALVGLASCSWSGADEVDGPPARQSEVGPSARPGPRSSAPPDDHSTPGQRAGRYRPHPSEIDVAAKRVAARAVEALPEVRRVTYTQYFGYLPPEASILVEADHLNGDGTTYDVRISQSQDGWQVETVTPATPHPPLPDPGALIRRVLDSDRIVLPWAARRDIAAGLVSEVVLRSMLAVARQHRISISVLISAHPVQVFGTDRRSSHPDGLAYDIGSVDGLLVVDGAAARRVRQVMRIAAETGAYQVGGPADLDGAGSAYFSDPTHSDHVHVGFKP